jgi:hypothetical protein
VPESNFRLNGAPWTKWQLVMAQSLLDQEPHLWEARNTGSIGYRRKYICGGKYTKPALYEFAVQTGERCKRYVVYIKSCKGFVLGSRTWESRLLNRLSIKDQINDILKKGYRLFARRCQLRRSSGMMNKMVDIGNYDYAWESQGHNRSTPREVQYRS